jgi:hypothetical protein
MQKGGEHGIGFRIAVEKGLVPGIRVDFEDDVDVIKGMDGRVARITAAQIVIDDTTPNLPPIPQKVTQVVVAPPRTLLLCGRGFHLPENLLKY